MWMNLFSIKEFWDQVKRKVIKSNYIQSIQIIKQYENVKKKKIKWYTK